MYSLLALVESFNAAWFSSPSIAYVIFARAAREDYYAVHYKINRCTSNSSSNHRYDARSHQMRKGDLPFHLNHTDLIFAIICPDQIQPPSTM